MSAAPASWGDLRARAATRHTLIEALLELTFDCNLDCHYCYNDRRLSGRLSTEEWVNVLEQLAELNVLEIALSGGEPLAHPGFFAIGAAARRLGFAIRVKSNGHSIDARTAARLRDEVQPFNLDVSIHGATAATHDRQTRVPGSFDRLLVNLRSMTAAGLRVRLSCTLTAWNTGEVGALLTLAEELGVTIALNPSLTPRDDGDLSTLALRASDEQIRSALQLAAAATDRACSKQRRPLRSCGAAATGIAIDPTGNVLPCVQWRRPLGNLRERPLREIWADQARLQPFRDTTAKALEVQGRIGWFCPAAAELASGDALRPIPALVLPGLRRTGTREDEHAAV